jgi:hypothetical protein
MAKFNIYAYAHMYETKVIQISSLGDFHNKITNTMKVEPGKITTLTTVWENIKKPFPFEFIWLPDKFIPAAFTNAVKPGYDFSLDLRLQVLKDDRSVESHFDLSFAQCKLTKSVKLGSKVKVDASCNWFRVESP